jgi:16S rRNA (uracil1498-N3)-methyltransferase
MARRRFFVDHIRNGGALLTGEDALHLSRVLRAQIGQQYELSDNHSVYLAEIAEVARDRVRFRVLEPVEQAPLPVRLTLLASLIKFERFEWLIEKATELGADALIPIRAERTDAGLWEAAQKRVERWRKIARESSQQSRRAALPLIHAPQQLAAASAAGFRYCYVLEETRGALPLSRALPPADARRSTDSVGVLVGPEGGWTDQERTALASLWTPVSLGPQILRAETAAMAALAVLMNAWLSAS